MDVHCPSWISEVIFVDLCRLESTQKTPFKSMFEDHGRCLQQLREQQVRLTQLDKEGAELREENANLHARVAEMDKDRGNVTEAEVKAAQTDIHRLEKEVSQLYKDKSRLLEELVAAGGDLSNAKKQVQALEALLSQSQARVTELQGQLASTSSALAHERASREAATEEIASALSGREVALSETERLKRENGMLVRRLVELKEGEIGRMNEINKLHEEALEQAINMRREAASDREAVELIRARLMGMTFDQQASSSGTAPCKAVEAAAGSVQAAAAAMVSACGLGSVLSGASSTAAAASTASNYGTAVAAPLQPGGTAAAVAAAAPTNNNSTAAGDFSKARLSLKDVMGLPQGATSVLSCERVLPRQPYKSLLSHKGGCSSLAAQIPGCLIASCGLNSVVHLWDCPNQGLGLMSGIATGSSGGPQQSLQGMIGAISDVAFTCDGMQVIGAGADKSLKVWDVTSGQDRHTLTGHSAGVTGVASDPLDNRVALSCSEDRCIKMWDLSRGYSVRSLPCTKMPSCLIMVKDGNTIATGHVDGTVSLWDSRQAARGSGSGPAVESRDHAQAICALSCTTSDTQLLVASKDNTITVWDMRNMNVVRTLRATGFSVGTIGSMGRGRCKIDMSVDGRFIVAGCSDGGVYVWDDDRGAGKGGFSSPPLVLRHHKEAVVAAAWSNDVSVLATADKGGTVALWSMMGKVVA
ncbi:hypothetical protein CEUSTIGMA_g5221.t1 [Chlamydomonas eustigma]|uniref:Autophagy-related protein 16 domain-containing protein n=1 Tax=Chlamydomonas eustigma TaxID=1157962 RepID=A0A250X3X5_9CHLO|nr:hypothetical protein CEUSTIGMA_g5221.t1 [Chlamydomonas eustigma]|eukprot:GAX77778.1 hypothetical protein CEUSTIGMA_g5221.t1 [Chlamydomonas eustigma]